MGVNHTRPMTVLPAAGLVSSLVTNRVCDRVFVGSLPLGALDVGEPGIDFGHGSERDLEVVHGGQQVVPVPVAQRG